MIAERLDPERHLEDLLEIVRGRWLVNLVPIARRRALRRDGQRRVVFLKRMSQPAGVDGHDDDEQREREQEMDSLEDVDDALRLAPVEVVDVEDDAVERLRLWRLAALVGSQELLVLLVDELRQRIEVALDQRCDAEQAAVVAR